MTKKNPVFRWIDERLFMCIAILVIGIFYMKMIPPSMVPDEPAHLWRAYEISHGFLLSDTDEEGIGGNFLPQGIEQYVWSDAFLDYDNLIFVPYPNTSLYSPVCYIPQVIGVKIGEIFTNNTWGLFRASRTGAFVFCLLMCAGAIYTVPFGRKVLFCAFVFPMSMQEMISVSPDGIVLSLAAFFMAYILNILYSDRKIRIKDILILGLMSFMLSMCKIVYLILVFLIFMIPKEKYEKKSHMMISRIALPAICVITNLIWLKIASGYLIEFNEGVNSGEQVKFILGHIPSYLVIALRTTKVWATTWIRTMAGSMLGWLNVPIPSFGWGVILILFTFEAAITKSESKYNKWNYVVVSLITITLGYALILTSLYVQWTPVQCEYINGIQGRYFIPLLFPGAFAVIIVINIIAGKIYKKVTEKGNSSLIKVSKMISTVRDFMEKYGFAVCLILVIAGNIVALKAIHSFYSHEGFY